MTQIVTVQSPKDERGNDPNDFREDKKYRRVLEYKVEAEQDTSSVEQGEAGGHKKPANRPPASDDLNISDEELNAAKLHPRCIVKDHTYADVAQVVAPGGTGKTTLLLHEAIMIALGRPVWGCDVESPGWTLYVSAEDRRQQLVARVREIINELGLSTADLEIIKRSVRIWDVAGAQMALILAVDGAIQLTALADNIVEAYKDDPPAVVIFDPLVSFGASENKVNDNEQGLITAARRIVRGLDCCVRVVHHTGKANARDKTIDQYSGRGGSAMADGSRMTTVLQVWRSDETSNPRPPVTLTADKNSSVTILARPKLSYAPPNLPLIWIKRTGFRFEHYIEIPVSDRQRLQNQADQILRFLTSELKNQRYYTPRTLDEKAQELGMTRKQLRAAFAEVQVTNSVLDLDLPKHLRQGRRKTFFCPAECAAQYGAIAAEDAT